MGTGRRVGPRHAQRGSCAELASGPPSQLKAAPMLAPFEEVYSCAERMRASTAVAFETRLTRSRSQDAPCAMACASMHDHQTGAAAIFVRSKLRNSAHERGQACAQTDVRKHGDAILFVEAMDARMIQRPPLAVCLRDVRRAWVGEEQILLVRLVQAGHEVGGASSEAKAPITVR